MTENIKTKLSKVGLSTAKIILPKDGVDLNKWAVVACDQFTSEPEYWKKVEEYVDEAPSTLKITLPEVYLEAEDKGQRIGKINETMKEYLEGGILEEKFEGFVLVDRKTKKVESRKGLVVALDLEKYDFHKGSKALIRATEGTVESRIPPRLEIRKKALVELPHIMVLIDDPSFAVSQLRKGETMKDEDKIYDFELMMNGGQVRGWKITDEAMIGQITDNLEKLISNDGFLFAMGDGNHSLATAKTHWENLKVNLSEAEKETHPARYALVELVNVHDSGLEFEPIHRIVYKVESEKLIKYIGGEGEEIEVVTSQGRERIKIKNMGSNLAVGNLQILLDKYIEENPETKIDYIHGEEAVERLVKEKNGIGFLLPVMKKEELFPTVEKDGALPRKTFSMGEAEEKRYYLEARKIVL
jgi:uncharacterized protein (DUF1015 family)